MHTETSELRVREEPQQPRYVTSSFYPGPGNPSSNLIFILWDLYKRKEACRVPAHSFVLSILAFVLRLQPS
ncbi:hypothetical protein BJX65DRAFT_287935 [Aspergillus insuetus]